MTTTKIPVEFLNALSGSEITDGSIATADIANDAITTAKIAANAITATELPDNVITATHIPNGLITGTHMAGTTITATQIANNAVGTDQLAGIARGKIIYGDSNGDPQLLALGSNGQVLTTDGTDISWGAVSGGVDGITSSADATAITIDSSENVGIGGSPGAKLDVNSGTFNTIAHFHSTDDNGFIELKDDDTTGYFGVKDDYVYIGGAHTLSTQNLVINDGNGNVGIGTTSPSSLLTIKNNGSGGTWPFRIFNSQDSDMLAGFYESSSGDGYNGMLYMNDGAGNVDVKLSTNGDSWFNGGNVGIGTDSPASALHLDQPSNNQAGGIYLERNGSSYGLSLFVDSGGYGVIGGNGSFTPSLIKLDFSQEYVGIGTSPATKLHIADTGGIELRLDADTNNNGQEDCFIRFYTDGGTQEGIAGMDNNNSSTLFSGNTENAMVFGTVSNLPTIFATNNTERLHITAGGRQRYNGSGTANAHATFVGEVGTGYKALAFERTVGGGEVGTIVANASSTTYNTSSDYRLKENIDYSWDATTRLKQLKPARFNWIKDDTNTLLEGFLAHEVSSIVPEAVSGEKDAVDADNNPDYQGIDHSKLVPLMVKTIQELEARIKTLEDA